MQSLYCLRSISQKFFLPVQNQYRYLQLYLLGVVFVNIFLVFFKGYSGDLGYWTSWLRQLSNKGYEGFDGNYPPVYIHVLYLIAKLYSWLSIPIENNNLLKLLTQIPVLLSHYLFVLFIYYKVRRFGWSSPWFHFVLALASFSPAILLNGPIWGQVDLIPVVILVCAISSGLNHRYSIMMIPLYVLSLLTKFQMVAFAPVIGFLFFIRPLHHLLGFFLSIIVIALAFSPWILLGEFLNVFKQAYIETLGQYPKTTFNAANMWIILTGNNAEDSRQLFNITQNVLLNKVGEAKYFGILLFSIISMAVFLRGVYQVVILKAGGQQLRLNVWLAALVCALAFFTILPAMHERYVFPAVIMAIVLAAENIRSIIIAILISVFSAANMIILLDLNGSDIWFGLSVFIVLVTCYSLLLYFIGDKMKGKIINFFWSKILAFRYLSLAFLIVSVFFSLSYIIHKYNIYQPKLEANQIFLGSLTPIQAFQDHGQLQVNQSYSLKTLSINGRRYGMGIGTHANSRIDFELPSGSQSLIFRVGVDDEVQSTDMQFIILGDEREIWRSSVIYGHEFLNDDHTVNLSGVKILSLVVNSVSDDKWDHANWINLILTVEND